MGAVTTPLIVFFAASGFAAGVDRDGSKTVNVCFLGAFISAFNVVPSTFNGKTEDRNQ